LKQRLAATTPLREWWLLLWVLVVLLTLLQQQGWLERMNATLYDAGVTLYQRALRDDLLVVAVDERSLAEYGRWPWRRARYAELIDLLSAAEVSAIGLDLILSEADTAHPEDDARLADAIRRNGHVVLPVLSEPLAGTLHATLPLPMLRSAAMALGHIEARLDFDGMARRTHLYCTLDGMRYAQFAQALRTSMPPHPAEPGFRCDTPYLIPFAARPGSVPTVSAAALLNGEVAAERLRGKRIFLGVTATGLGDAYPTPLSGEGYAMPGVEIHAQIADALDRGLQLKAADGMAHWLYAWLPSALLLTGYLWLLPRTALFATFAMSAAVIACSFGLLRFVGYWLPPAEALLGLSLCYPLWSWRKLESGMRFIEEEMKALQHESGRMPFSPPRLDRVAARIEAVRQAATELRALRELQDQSVKGQAIGWLVVDATKTVRLANPNACRLLGKSVEGLPVNQALATLSCPETTWSGFLKRITASASCETQDAQGRSLLLTASPLSLPGWVINLADISPLKAAEHERRRLLDFLSHDMRAPLTSILALLALNSDLFATRPSVREEIRQHVTRTLQLLEQFMLLARAESLQSQSFKDVDLLQCLHDAIDEIWPQASARGIELVRPQTECEIWVRGDGPLLQRALLNLLSNAVRHARHRVCCEITASNAEVVCAISDDGAGIPEAERGRLFQPFQRLSNAQGEGVGLGLALVHMVVEKHQGRIRVTSTPGQGARFEITLKR